MKPKLLFCLEVVGIIIRMNIETLSGYQNDYLKFISYSPAPCAYNIMSTCHRLMSA